MSGLDMNFKENKSLNMVLRKNLNNLCGLVGDCPTFDLLLREYASDDGYCIPYSLEALEHYVDEIFDRIEKQDLSCYSLIAILIMVHFNTRVNLICLDVCESPNIVPISRTHFRITSLYNSVRDIFVAKRGGHVEIYQECVKNFHEYLMKYFAGNEVFLYFNLGDHWSLRVSYDLFV